MKPIARLDALSRNAGQSPRRARPRIALRSIRATNYKRTPAPRWETMKIRAPKDFWAGVMFLGFAVVAVLAARGYSLGSADRMGPGYFPLLLGLVLGGL